VRKRLIVLLGLTLVGGLGLWFVADQVNAHCDTLDGPVVKDAKAALAKGDATPVLKWVAKEHEEEIRAALKQALIVRGKGPEAQQLADMFFFETVVRIHRAGEGAPFTGLKPAGTDLGPAVREADKALETGNPDGLVKVLKEKVEAVIRARFAHAVEKKKHADDTVEAGREFVAAYVEYVHYAERIGADGPAHGEGEGAKPAAHHHEE